MDNINASLKRLKSSSQFKDYHKHCPDGYLASCFKMGDSKLDAAWQFDFYSLKTNKMTSFRMDKGIEVQKDQDILSKGNPPRELELSKAKLGFYKVLSLANARLKKKLPSESVNNEIVILQELDDRAVWNITLLTSAFNVMNLRIDALDGNILSENCESVLSFKIK